MENSIRFALLMIDNSATTFDSIVLKLVKSILSDTKDSLNENEIVHEIFQKFDLEFSTKDILSAICSDNKNAIIKLEKNGFISFALSSKEKNKYTTRNNINPLEKILKKFTEDVSDMSKIIFKDIKNAILTYLYEIFNSNINNLTLLCNKKYEAISNINLTEEQRIIVEKFLNWKNAEKNRIVYSLINSSYEYCALSLGNSKPPFENMINSKVFVLDTNVILSTIGINGDNSRDIMLKFIEKCKNFNINLKYSNLTKDECLRTIEYLCNELKNYLKNNNFLTSEDLSNQNNFSNLYNLYQSWVLENPECNENNFYGFSQKLNLDLNNFLYDLGMLEISQEFIENNKNKINKFVKNFSVHKQKIRGSIKKLSINHDATLCVFVDEQNSKNSTFVTENKFFFITLDNLLYDWTKNHKTEKPYSVLSVNIIYTLLLRFSDRSNDDFEAYNKFLLFNMSFESEKTTIISLKNEILEKITKINETIDHKKLLILETNRIIENKLLNNEQISDSNVVIDAAYDNLLTILSEEQEEKSQKEKEKIIFDYQEREKEIIKKSTEEGRRIEVARNIRYRAKARIRRKKIFIGAIALLFLVALIFGIVFLVRFCQKDETKITWISLYVSLGGLGLPILTFIINSILKIFDINIFNISFEYNEEVERLKEEKRKD